MNESYGAMMRDERNALFERAMRYGYEPELRFDQEPAESLMLRKSDDNEKGSDNHERP